MRMMSSLGVLMSVALVASASVSAEEVAWRAKWIAAAPEMRADADMSGAKWIASAADAKKSAVFTRTFTFDGASAGGCAELVFVAVPRHEVRVNGREVDVYNDGQSRWYAARFRDLTPFLKPGENTIEIKVSEGRAVPDAGGVCACLARVNLPDGTSFGTDSSWRCEGGVKELGAAREPEFAKSVILRAESVSPAFEKTFAVRGRLASAKLHVTGVGFYEAYLNGAKIGDKVLDPSFTDFNKRVLYSTYDLNGPDARLKVGENTLKLLVGHGWYDVRSIAVWDFATAPWRDFPRAIAQLELVYEDGGRETVVTDGTWSQVTGPVLYDCIREGEVVTDAALPSAPVTGADGRALRASEVEGPRGALKPALHPGAKIVETFRPVRIRPCGEGAYMVEFPCDVAGWLRMNLHGQRKGDVVSVRYDERAGADLTPAAKRVIDVHFRYTASHRVCAKDAAFQTDRYICSGRDGETYEPHFTYNGFRYVLLKGLRAAPKSEDLLACRIRTDFPVIGSFACSDDTFNKLMEMGVNAYIGNFVDGYPTDCPHREKNGWTGDASIASELAQYIFENSAAYRKWLDDLMDTQRPDGKLCCIAPTSDWGYDWGVLPAWDSALPCVAWNLWIYRNDREILDRVYPALVKHIANTETVVNERGLIPTGLGDWNYVATRPSVELTSSCYFYSELRTAAMIADLKGLTSDRDRFLVRAARLRQAINARFYKGDGTYDDGKQTAQAFPLAFGVVAEGEREATARKLVESVEKTGRHCDLGLLGTKHVFRALSRIGRSDLAYAMLVNPTAPSPVDWLKQGGTSLWEDFRDGDSRNHIMYGDFLAWAYQYLAGIRLPEADGSAAALPIVTSRGFKHVLVAPVPVPQLTWVRAKVDGPNGAIEVEWHVADGKFTLDVMLGGSVTATVRLPDGTTREVGAGHTTHSCAFKR